MIPNQRENLDILFITPIGIGNVLLLIPTLRACKQALQRCRLAVVVTNHPSQEILEACPYVDEVILLSLPALNSPLLCLEAFRQGHQLRQRLFDVCITAFPCNHAFYNLLAYAVGAPVRIAHRYPIRNGSSLAFLQNVQVSMKRVHDVEQNLEILSPMVDDGDRVGSSPQLWLPEDARRKAEGFLTHHRQGKDPVFVGFHPGSSTAHQMSRKRWPMEKFIQLAQELLHGYYGRHNPLASGLRIILFGGPEETELNHRIARSIHPPPVVFFSSSMLETAAVIEQLSVFVSNDSGLMHVAAAVGVPTVGIFGPTDPARTAPYGEQHLVVRLNLECSPCWRLEDVGRRKRCSYATRRCLTELPVSRVKSAIDAALSIPASSQNCWKANCPGMSKARSPGRVRPKWVG